MSHCKGIPWWTVVRMRYDFFSADIQSASCVIWSWICLFFKWHTCVVKWREASRRSTQYSTFGIPVLPWLLLCPWSYLKWIFFAHLYLPRQWREQKTFHSRRGRGGGDTCHDDSRQPDANDSRQTKEDGPSGYSERVQWAVQQTDYSIMALCCPQGAVYHLGQIYSPPR